MTRLDEIRDKIRASGLYDFAWQYCDLTDDEETSEMIYTSLSELTKALYASEQERLKPFDKVKIKVKSWQFEDTLTEEKMYDTLFPLSKVSDNGIGVRIFPKEIEIVEGNR